MFLCHDVFRIKLGTPRWGCLFIYCLGVFYVLLAKDSLAEHSIESYSESQIKVAMVYKLMHFIDRPKNTPQTICIYHPNKEDIPSFDLLPSKTANGNVLKVVLLAAGKNYQKDLECQVIFFGSATDARTQKVFTGIVGENSLTIGETNQFIKHGGMIKLVRKDSTVKFEINLNALNQAGLSISSQVLRIADKVYAEGDDEGG